MSPPQGTVPSFYCENIPPGNVPHSLDSLSSQWQVGGSPDLATAGNTGHLTYVDVSESGLLDPVGLCL